jgi:hypothetical protein
MNSAGSFGKSISIFRIKERYGMAKQPNKVTEEQQVVAAQNQAEQFKKAMDTEFALEENVQDAAAKSQQYQVKNQQPTYEPNKPF